MASTALDVPRGDPARQEHDYAAPAARFFAPAALDAPEFAYPNDLRRNGRAAYFGCAPKDARLFLGVTGGQVRGKGRGRHVLGGRAVGYLDDRHMVTVAGSRGGKGRAAIVGNLLGYPGSMLVIDPKGELARLTAQHRAERLGQRVHVLDPFGVVTGPAAQYRTGCNLMAVMTEETAAEDAAMIGDGIVVPSDKEPHWDESARSFIEGGGIIHVATHPNYEGRRNLATVQQVLARGALDPDGQISMDGLQVEMEGNDAAGGAVQMAAADFFEKPANERGSVLSTARRHLKFLSLPGMRAVVSQDGFSLDVLKREAATIYLCLPARHARTCARWLRTFINQALVAMESIPGEPATGLPIIFLLEEFSSLGTMAQIEAAAAQMAGFGVKLWIILQDLGQLKSHYKDKWETFLGNAGVLQFFANNDLTTLEWISKRCGNVSIRVRHSSATSDNMKRSGVSGESWSDQVHPLLMPEEAAQIFGRDDEQLRQLIIIPGLSPIILQRAFYDQHERFRGLATEEMR